MSQHFTKRTVSATFYCGKCGKTTHHRIDEGRKGPCLSCIDRLEKQHAEARPPAEEQRSLFHGNP